MFFLVFLLVLGAAFSERTNLSVIQQTLQYVDRVAVSNCTHGTGEVLPMTFRTSAWTPAADIAVRTSNFLSTLFTHNRPLSDDQLFHLTYSNVESQPLLYGSWIGFEPRVHRGYDSFAPYTYQRGGEIRQKNVASFYDYRAPDNEWYMLSRNRSWRHLRLRQLNVSEVDNKSVLVPVIAFSDGTWTRPYYDCGSGNIWMVSYTVPFFTVKDAEAVFIGATGVDIDLSQIDINQCEEESENVTAVLSLFRGSHHCHAPSTECHFTAGKGFRRGAYRCQCRAGFYYPNGRPSDSDGFDGNEVENYWESEDEGDAGSGPFRCVACGEGCGACEDSTPCMYDPIMAVRATTLGLSVVLALLVVGLGVVVHRCRRKPPFRSGSPLFLIIMCIGGGVSQLKTVVLFLPPSSGQCMATAWLDIIGFSAIFGSLLLKTWRVAALCTVASSRPVAITDRILLRRLVPVFLCAAVYLSVWTLTAPETTLLRHTRTGLKFLACSYSWWLLTAHIVETGFLFWGAYICFRVRNAPSAFNESRYITWSIYNAALTGNFLFFSSLFLAWQEGPDVVFVSEFLRTLMEAVVTIVIIIVPKICAVTRAAHASNGHATLAGKHKILSNFHRVGSALHKTVATQTESQYVLPRCDPPDETGATWL